MGRLGCQTVVHRDGGTADGGHDALDGEIVLVSRPYDIAAPMYPEQSRERSLRSGGLVDQHPHVRCPLRARNEMLTYGDFRKLRKIGKIWVRIAAIMARICPTVS